MKNPSIVTYIPHGGFPDKRGFGPSIVAQELINKLPEFDHRVIAEKESLEDPSHEISGKITIDRISEGKIYRRLFKKWSRLDPYPLWRRAADIISKHPASLVHAHQLEFPVTDFRKRLAEKIPILVHAHVTTQRFSPARGEADRYIAASTHIARTLAEKGYPQDRIAVVRNGVDTDLFRPASPHQRELLRERNGIAANSKIVIFFGRKQEVKGYDVFLRAAERLISERANVHILAIGPEPPSAKRESCHASNHAIMLELASTGRFSSLPAVKHAALRDYIQSADIAVLPSREEPQGMAMIEAMACGIPVISSRVGGILESIEDGTNGYLLDDPEDAATLYALTERLLSDTALRDAIGKAARAKAVDTFDWSYSAQKIQDVYLELLA